MSPDDMAQQERSASRPVQLDELDALIGAWTTRGHVLSAEGQSAAEVIGTDAYEWLDGGYFVVHRVDVHVADEPVKAIEIISFDPKLGTFTARSYDNTGEETVMTATVSTDGVWRFEGGGRVAESATPSGEPASAAVRSTLTIAEDRRSMHADWERSTDGRTWVSWMRVDFTQ